MQEPRQWILVLEARQIQSMKIVQHTVFEFCPNFFHKQHHKLYLGIVLMRLYLT